MERNEYIAIVATITGAGYVFMICSQIVDATKEIKDTIKKQNEWLFEQLYSMAPGKVLRPDEIETVTEVKPAKIINRNKDPMNEFNGKTDDWHEGL